MIDRNIAKVIVSPIAIPDHSLGSWGKLIDHWLQSYDGNQVDYILCPKSLSSLQSDVTKALDCSYTQREINKDWFIKWRFRKYEQALEQIFQKHDGAVIVILENTKLKNIVSQWLAKKGLASKAKVIFYQPGFSYEFTRDEYKDFKKGLNEMILLTKSAYQYERMKYHEYPFLVHVLYNPMDATLFRPLDPTAKAAARNELGWQNNETIFLWVSHDRPKKGLEVILRVWQQAAEKYPLTKLVVVGVKRDTVIKGVQFLGKLPNQEIARYYQAADVFLFSSLCQEGFPLSLAEAMSSGCYCIASDAGGVAEFLVDTGHAINYAPAMADEWMMHIDNYMQQKPISVTRGSFMSLDEWCGQFQTIMDRSAASL